MKLFRFLVLFFVVYSFTACKKESNPADSSDPLEETLPNAITLTLVSSLSSSQETVKATWRTTNPTGSGMVTIDTLRLRGGVEYEGTLTAINDLQSPVEDLTEDYKKYADEHQLFYTPMIGNPNRVTIKTIDKDNKGLPLGLKFTCIVSQGVPATGTLNVVLSHFDPNESLKKNGTSRSPESDFDITFPVVIR